MLERCAHWTGWVLLSLFFSFSVPASAQGEDPAADPFPSPAAIADSVDFWVRVFAEWGGQHVVLHDTRCPSLIYEVVELPGAVGDRTTAQQKALVESARGRWESYLTTLEKKVALSQPLSEVDKQWAIRIASSVGTGGVEGAAGRLRSQRGLRQRFLEGLSRSHRYDAVMRAILREEGLPEDLVFLPHVESSFQYHARSSAGAAGVWQFTRSTGRRYLRIDSSIDERLDPVAATRAAARYLREAHDLLGCWALAVTSYNHGVHGMLRAKERFGTDFDRIVREYDSKSFGFASRNFYAEFLAARIVASDPSRFFPEGYTAEPPLDDEFAVLDRRTTPGNLASRYGVGIADLARRNLAWSQKAVQANLALPAGSVVWLPSGTLERIAHGDAPRPAPATARVEDDGSVIAATRTLRVSPPAPSTSETARRAETHVVRTGQTLSGIARLHRVSLAAVREANGLAPGEDLIRVGQRLRIPRAAPESAPRHVVNRGDTLFEIATRHGVRLVDLLTANMLTAQSVIQPGQILHIP